MLLAYQMALESDLIQAHMVEVVEFPYLGNKYQVMGVPRTVIDTLFLVASDQKKGIDETIHIEGAVPEPMLMKEFAKLLK